MDNQYGLRSTTRVITVNQPIHAGNTAPQVTLISPATNATQLAPGAVCLQASVTPGNSPVTNVVFFLNGILAGNDLNPPYSLALGTLAPAHYTATCRAIDTNGLITTSASLGFDVLPNIATPLTVNVSGTNYPAIQFHHIPAATNLTSTVDTSGDLATWNSGSIYSFGGDTPSGANTTQVSRSGTNLETIVVRDNAPLNAAGGHFMRVRVTVP